MIRRIRVPASWCKAHVTKRRAHVSPRRCVVLRLQSKRLGPMMQAIGAITAASTCVTVRLAGPRSSIATVSFVSTWTEINMIISAPEGWKVRLRRPPNATAPWTAWRSHAKRRHEVWRFSATEALAVRTWANQRGQRADGCRGCALRWHQQMGRFHRSSTYLRQLQLFYWLSRRRFNLS